MLPTGFALPPVVRQSAPLFHKRDDCRMLPMPEASNTRHQPPPVQRPASPPPEYDDLFGIETVSVSASSTTTFIPAKDPPPPVRADFQLAPVSRRPSLASLATVQQADELADPADQIQRLLRDMMGTKPANSIPAVPLIPRASGSNGALIGVHQKQPQFDDARTEDLFQQLCRL